MTKKKKKRKEEEERKSMKQATASRFQTHPFSVSSVFSETKRDSERETQTKKETQNRKSPPMMPDTAYNNLNIIF